MSWSKSVEALRLDATNRFLAYPFLEIGRDDNVQYLVSEHDTPGWVPGTIIQNLPDEKYWKEEWVVTKRLYYVPMLNICFYFNKQGQPKLFQHGTPRIFEEITFCVGFSRRHLLPKLQDLLTGECQMEIPVSNATNNPDMEYRK